MSQTRIGAVILAAGKGTRLKTDAPKVLHEVCGRPMLAHVFDACRAAGAAELVAVVGYKKQSVIDAFPDDRIEWVEQAEQKGTGHAVMVCREAVAGRFEHVLVLCGDGPLIRAETIRLLIERHISADAAATLATAEIADPSGYGRIVRDGEGRLLGIVEHGDCDAEQRRIREVNPSYYCFRAADLLETLQQVRPNNVKNEYYITDCIALLIESGRTVNAITAVPPEDILSINSRQDLARVNAVMRERVNARLMDSGVTIVDPANTWVDPLAEIGQDTVLYPFVMVSGAARIGRDCRIGPFAHVTAGMRLGDGVTLRGAVGGES